MYRVLMALCFFGAPDIMFAQKLYKDIVFSRYTVEKDLRYSKVEKYAVFNLYRPKTDSVALRPLIIWMHGGGFKFGSKKAAGVKVWCGSLAQRGWICAAINYKLGNKSLKFTYKELVTNCNRAVQDVRTALAYFKANAALWGIDTTRIILAGNSAGGMLAMQAVYSPGSGYQGVAAIVNFWGGIFDTAWLHNAQVPIVSVHGTQDGIVPYDHKGYPLYGSLPIHRMADSLHIPNALKAYEGFSHELQKHFNPFLVSGKTRQRWLEATQFAADFLYKELFAARL